MDQLRQKLVAVRVLAGVVLVTTLASTAACGKDVEGSVPAHQSLAADSAPAHGEGGSPVSLDSALALFRVGLAPAARLEDGAGSGGALVERLVQGLSRSDTSTLRSIVMSRREFAYLFYPSSPFTRAPTKQEPALAWFLHLQASQKGVTRLLNRYGGAPLVIVDHQCRAPIRMGSNTLWSDCVQRIARGPDTTAVRLFGGMLERGGRFKIFSYSNDL